MNSANQWQESLAKETDPAKRSEIYCSLGEIHAKNDSLNEAIAAYINAIKLDPSNQMAWSQFANIIQDVTFRQYHETIKQMIVTGLSKTGLNHQHFAIPGISLLKLSHDLGSTQVEEKIISGQFKLLEDRLFIRLLEKTLLPDSEIENLLISIRKIFLKLENAPIPKHYEKFIYALAKYCFYSEYVFQEDPSETDAIEKLLATQPSQLFLAILGCYRPLSQLPLEDREIIPYLKPLSNTVSKEVAAQYEENPYPRWKHANTHPISQNFAIQDILIAGCGTGQQAINLAFMHPKANILAIDLSKKSLAYAIRKARELNVRNIQFLQADILDLESLNRTFDLIECFGVLHHMQDPVEGWRVLKKLLRPDGMMGIGLYSELARQDIVAARKFIQEKGFLPTVEGIRQCRKQMMALPEGDPIHGLSHSLDFYSLSGCRDLLFHVQEHRFTLPQIKAILDELGLTLIKFDVNDRTLKKYRELFSDDDEAVSLENWEQFERQFPHTFTGMYAFWVRLKKL